MSNPSGYTLIELLVVVSIIGIMSLVGFVSFRGISANQISVKAAGEVQTLLRLAQSNATTSTLCNGLGALSWKLLFNLTAGPNTTIRLFCSNSTTNHEHRVYTLENAEISLIKGSSGADCKGKYTELTYLVGVGTLTFSDGFDNCIKNSNSLTITVRNKNNTTLTKNITIYKGGRIDVR